MSITGLLRILKNVVKLALLALLIISCRESKDTSINSIISSQDQVIKSAHCLSIERKGEYSIVTIKNPWQGAENISMTYYLVKRGNIIPSGVDSSKVIYVPVNSIICMSTTHVGMISAIGEETTIKGLSGTGFIYNPSVKQKIRNGLIHEVGYEASLNQELIISIYPDIVMIYGIGNESAGYVSKIKELGINVIFNADYLETDPLGKAEWIKLFGALYCKENVADSIFESEVKDYNLIRDFVLEHTTDKPAVMLGLPFKDSWFISPGNSFVSKLINDAGGNYLWKNTKSSVSMPYGLENVFITAMDADFWFNIGTVSKFSEISLVDNRLSDLRCFKKKNLYNNNKRITEDGGNDYWESGTLHPHIILKDMASMLHPDLFPGYEPFYYKKLE